MTGLKESLLGRSNMPSDQILRGVVVWLVSLLVAILASSDLALYFGSAALTVFCALASISKDKSGIMKI